MLCTGETEIYLAALSEDLFWPKSQRIRSVIEMCIIETAIQLGASS